MSPSESKRSKRRKNKRGRVQHQSNPAASSATTAVVQASKTASATASDETNAATANEFNPGIDADTTTIQSTVLEEMQRLMDEEAVDDGAAQNASFSSDLYLGNERCLLCHCERLQIEEDDSTDGVTENELDDKNASSTQLPLWVCPDCKKMVEEEQNRGSFDPKKSFDNLSIGSEAASLPGELEGNMENPETPATCQCNTCSEQRIIKAEQTREMEELRSCWMELKMALHKIYRDSGLPLGEATASQQILANTGGPLPPTEHLKGLVYRLCSYDQHKLYQCLEAHVRLFVVEMRLRLLHRLAMGPQVGKSFVRAMLEEYTKLCLASKQMAPILQELEAKHLRRFNLTWELVNRRLFQCIVYQDTILRTGLPELSSVRLNSPNKDKCHHDTYTALTKFDDEMTVIAVVWKEAQQLIDDYDQEQVSLAAVRMKKKALKDWEIFNTHWQMMEDEAAKKTNFQFVHQCSCNECTASQHLNSTHLASNLLTPMELASLAEQASGSPCHTMYSNHNGKLVEHLSNHQPTSNASNPSSVPLHCEGQGQVMHCLNPDSCNMPPSSHTGDAPPPLLKVSHTDMSSPSILKLSKVQCDGSSPPSERTGDDMGDSKCVLENSFITANGGSPTSAPSVQQCCGGCLESQCCHKGFSSKNIVIGSSAPPPSPHGNKQVLFQNSQMTTTTISGCTELTNQHGLHDGESPEDLWKDIILEKQCISDGQSCECHACTQLKDQLVLASGSIGHIAGSLPVFPSVNDVVRGSPCSSKPLVHSRLYKGVASTVLASKTVPQLQWSLNLDLETKAVQQEQAALAMYGDWNFDAEDTRSVLTHQKYGGCLGNDVVFSAHPSPHSHLLNGSIHGVHPGNREDMSCMTLPSPVSSVPQSSSSSSSAETGILDRQSLLTYATQKLLPSDEVSGSGRTLGDSGGGGGGNGEKHLSPGKKHHHTSNPLCANHLHGGNGCADCFPMGNPAAPHVPQTTVAVKQVTVSKDHSLVTSSASSTTPVTVTNSSTQCAVPNYKLIPNANSTYCGEPDCEGYSQEGEESVDDSCSEQSSSTTASNQRESRVCDCCYCEVFGHGMPAMAPVSRNYPEMRERLRLRLSKRKAEGMIAARKQNQEKSEQMVDERALEELLNFINGTEHAQESSKSSSSSSSKAAKRHRKKLKKAEEKATNDQCNTKDLQSSQLQQQQERRSCQKKEETMNAEARMLSQVVKKVLAKCKESPESMQKTVEQHRNEASSQKQQQQQQHHSSNANSSRGDNASPPPPPSPAPVVNGKSPNHGSAAPPKQNGNSTAPKNTPSKQVPERNPSPEEQPSCKKNMALPVKQVKVATKPAKSSSPVKSVQRNNSNSNCTSSVPEGQQQQQHKNGTQVVHRKDNCTYAVLSCVKATSMNSSMPVPKGKEQEKPSATTPNATEETKQSNVVEPNSSSTANGNGATTNGNSNSNNLSGMPANKKIVADAKLQQSESVQVNKNATKSKRSKKKKTNVDDITSPDDVFMPKDIDLEDGELDEVEKELEAFKRFCFNSVPLANKEKVHVNLKDIVIKRKPAFGNSGGQYYTQRP